MDSTARSTQHSLDAELHGVIEEAMAHYHVPGVAVGIYHDGTQQVGGLGVTNVDHPLAVDEQTLYQIGSITKPSSARRRCASSTGETRSRRADPYLPAGTSAGRREATERATMKHLLTHTGGWVGDYFDDSARAMMRWRRWPWRWRTVPQVAPLGTLWSYNNAGFYLAGRVIEVIAGKPFEEAVQEFVSIRLACAHLFLRAQCHHGAVRWSVIRSRMVRRRRAPVGTAALVNPAGGLLSDVPTCSSMPASIWATAPRRTARASFRRRACVHAIAALLEGQPGRDGPDMDAGGCRRRPHRPARWRDGRAADDVRLVPSRHFALTVLTNAEPRQRVARRGDEMDSQPLPRPRGPGTGALDATAEQLAPYAGRYTAAGTDLELPCREMASCSTFPKGGFPNKGVAAPEPPPPVRAALYDEDLLIGLDEPMKGTRGEFLRGPDGAIAWLRLGSRAHRRV